MENKLELKQEEQNNVTLTSNTPKTKGKAVKTAVLALCCSLVGSALGAGGVLAVDRFLVKPDVSISRSQDNDQMPEGMNNFFRRPDQEQSQDQDQSQNQSQNDQESNSQGRQAPPGNPGSNNMFPGQNNQDQSNQPASGQQIPGNGQTQQNGNMPQNSNGQIPEGSK